MQQFLLVLPNPFCAFDKEGVPCGLCPRDPDADAGGPGQFVGARVDRKNTQVLQQFKQPNHELRSAMQVTRYEYLGVASQDPELAQHLSGKDPIRLPVTKYYKDRLREQALIPADAATAKLASLPRFVEPKAFFSRHIKPAELQGATAPADGTTVEVELDAAKLPEGESLGGLQDAPGAQPLPAESASENATTKTRGKRSEG